MNNKTNWFWAHRRNATLHHFSFLLEGLNRDGWSPVVKFTLDNQIAIGVPGKGVYLFYDRDQLSSSGSYGDIQNSIDLNPNFVADFQEKTNQIFGEIARRADKIEKSNLEKIDLEDIRSLYVEFLDAIMVAPIVTVQMWGIEACMDKNYHISRFLKKYLTDHNKENEYQKFIDILSVNTSETIAVAEQKAFYRVAMKIIGAGGIDAVKGHKALIEEHMKEYEWVHTEYKGEAWSEEKWMSMLDQAILDDVSPAQRTQDIEDEQARAIAERDKLIAELNPPQEFKHALGAMSEFIAQRDNTKGKMAQLFLSYHKLLSEVANRMGIELSDVFQLTYKEVQAFLESNALTSLEEIEIRKTRGFALVIKGGNPKLVTGEKEVHDVIIQEGISDPFGQVTQEDEIKGASASRGVCIGKARVMEDASRLNEFQKGEIIVTYMTTVEFTPVFRKAAAVVTDEGGLSSHAAITSREYKIPCVVGTKIATRSIKTGDEIEVDGDKGIVRRV